MRDTYIGPYFLFLQSQRLCARTVVIAWRTKILASSSPSGNCHVCLAALLKQKYLLIKIFFRQL